MTEGVMGKLYDHINDRLEAFIKSQHIFFVATAPLEEDGHVNVSPKGLDTFAILDPHTVAYQDFSGSGAETIAHLKQNGRITIMFCAFEGPPLILRLYGQGEVLEPDNPGFNAVNKRFAFDLGVRSIIRIGLARIQDSCGFGVPLYDFVKPRDTLLKWAEKKGEQGIAKFKREHNVRSIDGLLALEVFDRPQ
jgi:predicted pyridoxine 5'-phosphate oxidase superfamily flavin-nucleotide-binding protein